ncbi:hypothetical protein NJR55_00845 [Idiomarina sp. M1R2S28]|uniref:Uncharacterized protein n=1 Tax=Idiomarina rhizosphaerae TaxID=2961572 RepID=A0A9X2JQ92_9GAMM|nr:hypothetical protein [Idiomarina rhizosphaerae]MCP1338127.1 hypothetical protein [Idiomarina rhizosphaerae]
MQIDTVNQPTAVLTRKPDGTEKNVGPDSVSSTKNNTAPTKPNFANMTQSDLFNWANEKAKAGELSPKEMWSFSYLAMDIPVGKELSAEDLRPDDAKLINFFDKVQDGIRGAISNDDSETKQRLESVLSIMKREQQGQINLSV